MSFFSDVFDFIKAVYSFPFEQWNGREVCRPVGIYQSCTTEEPDKLVALVSGFALLAVTIMLLLILLAIGRWIYAEYYWRKNNRPCKHCNEPTTSRSSGEHPEFCREGDACCTGCWNKHILEAYRTRKCPDHDGILMDVIEVGDYLAHQCSFCSLVVMDDELLDALRRPQPQPYEDRPDAAVFTMIVLVFLAIVCFQGLIDSTATTAL